LAQTPPLAQEDLRDGRRAFWIIKHGIKMSAMPAWGKTLAETYQQRSTEIHRGSRTAMCGSEQKLCPRRVHTALHPWARFNE
jgi:hypothetical protein